jgi:hypothetical protein
MSETDEYKALKAKGATQDELTARFITRVNALVAERVSITPGEVVKAVAESMKK